MVLAAWDMLVDMHRAIHWAGGDPNQLTGTGKGLDGLKPVAGMRTWRYPQNHVSHVVGDRSRGAALGTVVLHACQELRRRFVGRSPGKELSIPDFCDRMHLDFDGPNG